jgi:hypothetical protein
MVFGYVYIKNPSSLFCDAFFSTLGIPFNDSVNWRLTIAEKSQHILGDNLLGLQAGNEPDFYAMFVPFFPCPSKLFSPSNMSNLFRNGHRPSTYAAQDYANDVGNLITAMEANSGIPNKNMLICPSVATGPWTPEQVWDTGFIDTYNSYLSALAVEQ